MDSGFEWPAVSVRQPWANLLIDGRKSIEIRTWAPDYRGRLWLHAGIKTDPELERRFGLEDAYKGGFIGSIQLEAVVALTDARWQQWLARHLSTERYQDGMLAWLMESPRRFKAPVPARGQLGLFRPAETLLWRLVDSDAEATAV
jgi:hypothetical protein